MRLYYDDLIKNIPSFGIDQVAHKNHHTSHLHKVQDTVSSAFSAVDHDIEKGGWVFKVRLDRLGRTIKVKNIMRVNLMERILSCG